MIEVTVRSDDEYGSVEIGCLSCHLNVTATIGFAHPVRMYQAALNCECGQQIVEWEI